MDEFATVDVSQGNPPPEKLRPLFSDPEQVRVQALPCALEGLSSKAVHFPAGVRTRPHIHPEGQHIIITEGVGVVGDETGVRVVHPGDVISSPAGAWHWHGAVPTKAMSHVTVEFPGLDLDVEPGDYDEVYTADLGS